MPADSPVGRVLARLQGFRQSSSSGWMARCPAHDDRAASLALRVGDDGRALLHCHAGCRTDDVVRALGLTMRDLFPPGANGRAPVERRLTATYDYHDETGAVLFQVCRYEPKDFRQRRPDGTWSTRGVRRVPYRLPELPIAIALEQRIYVAEGEKDVDALRGVGVTATCNPGGARKWRREYADYLRGAHAVILPDNDVPGRRHAEQVAASLFGTAASVRVLELPGLPDHGDPADWIAAGGTADELRRLSDAAEDWRPVPAAAADVAAAAPVRVAVEDFTDVANAARLARLHADRIRYVPKWGAWLVWDGAHWVRDDRGVRVMELAKDVGWALLREAVETGDDRAKKAGIAAHSAARIRAAVELARGAPGMMVEPDDLDRDGWLLGVRNGVIDLRTGELRAADPADLMTMQAPVEWDPRAEAPRWERALAEWFPDVEVRSYVQRLVGAALVGEQRDHVFVIHYGEGANGKGTFVRALLAALGPYAVTPHMSLLVQLRHGEHDTVKATLFRARLAVASETDRRVKLAEASIKNLTGRDRITCRRLYENPWEFTPGHSLWLQTNHLPEIAGRDEGIWRRIKVVQWVARFDRSPDADLDAALAAEAPGILRWAVDGCAAWQERGLTEPEAVVRATLSYRRSEDAFERFAEDERLEFGPSLRCSQPRLTEAYREWAEREGLDVAPREFRSWLETRGCRTRRSGGRGSREWVWMGVGRASEDADEPDF